MFAEESAAALRVLAHNGCTVVTPKETVCCGMPALGFGKVAQVQEQARHNIATFEKANIEFIITDCATCGSTLKDYGNILVDDPEWADRAAAFSKKVRDISEFLLIDPAGKTVGAPGRASYLSRSMPPAARPGRLEATARPVANDRWAGIRRTARSGLVLGLAGTQLITHYETSLKVLKRKTNNLAATQAGYVASGCPACQMQLNVGVMRAGLDVQVVHPITLLDRAYGTAPKESDRGEGEGRKARCQEMQEGKMMDKKILAQLGKITGRDSVLTSPEDLAVYSYDGTFEEGCPEVVVLPRTTEQVSQVVKLAAQSRIPLVSAGDGVGAGRRVGAVHGRNRAGHDTHEPYPGDRSSECNCAGLRRA